MAVTQEMVQRLAQLTKIAITPAEALGCAGDLNTLDEMARQLDELDTDGIVPATHGVVVRTMYREDAAVPQISREELLAGAPQRDDTCFLAPKVLD